VAGPPPAPRSGGRRAAVAVDLGSGQFRVWAAGDGIRAAASVVADMRHPTREARLVRRGRIVDPAGSVALLTRLAYTLPSALTAGPVVVACRPVSASPGDEDAIRRVVTDAFTPSRVLLIDTVRAAAIGCGAAGGALLVIDAGAQLTEVSLLLDGRVAVARRAETGTADGARSYAPSRLTGVITRLVADIGRSRRLTGAALSRGAVVVGDGATMPGLTNGLAASLGARVWPATSPRLAAVGGAGLAATALGRHPATAVA
jgi:rod shape-determining protein MreB